MTTANQFTVSRENVQLTPGHAHSIYYCHPFYIFIFNARNDFSCHHCDLIAAIYTCSTVFIHNQKFCKIIIVVYHTQKILLSNINECTNQMYTLIKFHWWEMWSILQTQISPVLYDSFSDGTWINSVHKALKAIIKMYE